MNTSAVQYTPEPCWSRRCSIESTYSIQGKETDFVRDTTDTDSLDDTDLEYEPCSAPEDDPPTLGDSSGQSDNEIIATQIIEVSVGDDGDLEFADSEQTATDGSDSELDLCDYGRCAQCRGNNTNPMYRYCEKCFKVRKNFFPPRPKRKHKRKLLDSEQLRPLSQDSGVCSQGLTDRTDSQELEPVAGSSGSSISSQSDRDLTSVKSLKRRAKSVDRPTKRAKTYVDSYSDSDSDIQSISVSPPVKTVSDPSLTVENVNIKKVISDSLEEKNGKDKVEKDNKSEKDDNMCIVCLTEPKSGVFAHGRIAHICCCYKCAVKVWAKAKRCPICNCKVSNVLKAVIM